MGIDLSDVNRHSTLTTRVTFAPGVRRDMTHRTAPTLLALATGLLIAAAPAQADTLETPLVQGMNLASSADWKAWSSAQADGTSRLQLRKPDRTVVTPEIPAFGAPVDPAIGTRGGADGINTPASRRLSAVYSRCAGSSALTGCDVYALDLTTLREEQVATLASKAYSETAPGVTFGSYSFVRRGSGALRGTYACSERGGLRRLNPMLALETATSISRMASPTTRPRASASRSATPPARAGRAWPPRAWTRRPSCRRSPGTARAG